MGREPHPFLTEHGDERLARARRSETLEAMRARYREMGHPDDGGAYMVDRDRQGNEGS